MKRGYINQNTISVQAIVDEVAEELGYEKQKYLIKSHPFGTLVAADMSEVPKDLVQAVQQKFQLN